MGRRRGTEEEIRTFCEGGERTVKEIKDRFFSECSQPSTAACCYLRKHRIPFKRKYPKSAMQLAIEEFCAEGDKSSLEVGEEFFYKDENPRQSAYRYLNAHGIPFKHEHQILSAEQLADIKAWIEKNKPVSITEFCEKFSVDKAKGWRLVYNHNLYVIED